MFDFLQTKPYTPNHLEQNPQAFVDALERHVLENFDIDLDLQVGNLKPLEYYPGGENILTKTAKDLYQAADAELTGFALGACALVDRIGSHLSRPVLEATRIVTDVTHATLEGYHDGKASARALQRMQARTPEEHAAVKAEIDTFVEEAGPLRVATMVAKAVAENQGVAHSHVVTPPMPAAAPVSPMLTEAELAQAKEVKATPVAPVAKPITKAEVRPTQATLSVKVKPPKTIAGVAMEKAETITTPKKDPIAEMASLGKIAVFNEAYNHLVKEVLFKPEWNNGTGYAEKMVHDKQLLSLLQKNSAAKFTMTDGRRGIVVRGVKAIAIVFERYTFEEQNKPNQTFVGHLNRERDEIDDAVYTALNHTGGMSTTDLALILGTAKQKSAVFGK